MSKPPRPLLERLRKLEPRGSGYAELAAEAADEIERLSSVISDSQRKLDRMSQVVTPDRNMAEQIALYLDGQARTLDGSSMEYMQLRRAAEWMRCLNPAPDTQALRDYAEALEGIARAVAGWEGELGHARPELLWWKQCQAAAMLALAKDPAQPALGSLSSPQTGAQPERHETGRIPSGVPACSACGALPDEDCPRDDCIGDEPTPTMREAKKLHDDLRLQSGTQPPQGTHSEAQTGVGPSANLWRESLAEVGQAKGEMGRERHQVFRKEGDRIVVAPGALREWPHIAAILAGTVAGDFRDWPKVRAELLDFIRVHQCGDSQFVAGKKSEQATEPAKVMQPCPACDGHGYRTRSAPGHLSSRTCEKCHGDRYILVDSRHAINHHTEKP